MTRIPLSRLGLATLTLTGVAALLLSRVSAGPTPDTATQPVYLAYTVNNIGYVYTCG